jgi:AbrB family looped-hinge helix DNA binding protein
LKKGVTMNFTTVSAKGWVTIPVELRRKYGLKSGARVRIVDYGGVLALVPVTEDPVQQAMGMLKGSSSLTQALLTEHKQELSRE